jgi:hypothetical protein
MKKAYAFSDALPQVALLFALLWPALPHPVLVWSTLPCPALLWLLLQRLDRAQ